VSPAERRTVLGRWAQRLVGLVVLAVLLWRVELTRVGATIRQADLVLLFIAGLGVVPLILIKAIRWRRILAAQSLEMGMWAAFLAYFGGVFIGQLTPGRLGEFAKALHVSGDLRVSPGRAVSSVLVDRLFDVYALLTVGVIALLMLADRRVNGWEMAAVAGVAALPLPVLLTDAGYRSVRRVAAVFGSRGERLVRDGGWLSELRDGIRQLTSPVIAEATVLTAVSFVVFFVQCYLIAVAIHLPVDFSNATFASALGSLASLPPISISGLGTREVAIVAYLGQHGIRAEAALSFSLLQFVVFYLSGAVFGAAAWWLKPLPRVTHENAV